MENKDFSIELNNPQHILPGGKDHNLTSIFTTCFDFPTEDFEIWWNGIRLELSYKYEVPYLLYPLLDMLNAIVASNKGQDRVSVGMDSLQVKWNFSWDEEKVVIHSVWTETPQDVLNELNEKSDLEVSIKSFLAEWLKLIDFIAALLDKSRIEIQDSYYNRSFLDAVREKMLVRMQ